MTARPAAAPTTAPVAGAGGVAADAGFSMVEVVVSVVLFAIASGAAVLALTTAVRFAESNENRVVAAGLATAQVEQVRSSADPATLSAGTSSVVRNGTTFSITRLVHPVAGCTAARTRTVTITVDWSGPGEPVRSDTVRAC